MKIRLEQELQSNVVGEYENAVSISKNMIKKLNAKKNSIKSKLERMKKDDDAAKSSAILFFMITKIYMPQVHSYSEYKECHNAIRYCEMEIKFHNNFLCCNKDNYQEYAKKLKNDKDFLCQLVQQETQRNCNIL